MMKQLVMVLLFWLSAGLASAQTAATEEVRVFQNASSDAGWIQFEQELRDMELLRDGAFPARALSVFAVEYVQANNLVDRLPEGIKTVDDFYTAFEARNNLSEFITVEEFRAQGQGEGFWLPPLKIDPIVALMQEDQRLRDMFFDTEQRVLMLATAASEVATGNQQELSVLKNQMTALRTEFEDLTERNAQLISESARASASNRAEIEAELASVTSQLNSLRTQLNETLSNAEAVLPRVQNLEARADVIETKLNRWIFISLIALVLLLVLGVILWATTRRPLTAVKNDVEQVKKDVVSTKTEVVQVMEEKLEEVGEMIRSPDRPPVYVDPNLPKELNELTSASKAITTEVTYHGKTYLVGITFHGISGDSVYVTLSGVAGGVEDEPVNAVNVPRTLKKAAPAGRLTNLVSNQKLVAVR